MSAFEKSLTYFYFEENSGRIILVLQLSPADSINNVADIVHTALGDIVVVANFAKDTPTGIDLSDIGEEVVVYNLEGMVVSRHADKAVLRRLPKGVYIVNGRKVVID